MEIVTAIGSKLGEYLVEGIINQARYIFCFNNIVKDLEHEEKKLKGAQERIKKEVKREEKNTKVIEKEVAEWLNDVDDVTKDVEELKVIIQADKSCLKGWCPNCSCRYWLGRKAAKKTITMAELRNDSNNFKEVAHLKPLPGIEFSASSDFMSFEATELASNRIIEALKDESVKMVGLYGSGGVGKTTLAKNIGNMLKQQKFFDDVVVAVISQNPDFKKIQNKLAEQLSLNFEEKEEENRAKRLYMRFIDPESKILIILDDVWEKHDLKTELGIPVDDNHSGCKILLTTRLLHVCDRMGCNPRIPLGVLKSEEGLALLRKYGGIHDDDSTLIEVSKEVASECKGLPLAIAVVGSALRGREADEWKLVCHLLKKAKLIEIDGIDRDVYACLKLSYDYLRDEKAKFCFMLCSLYPEDHEIDLEDLIRYGVGLDWYQDVTIEEVRIQLHGIIKGLKASSLLLDTGKERFVKMHDIVRDVAIWIGSTEKIFMSKAGFGLTKWPKDESMGHYKAISLVETEIKELPKGLVCPNLEILLLGSQFSKMVIPDQFFEGMRKLKIVIIIGGDLSPKSLQYLTDLQVLKLTKCRIRDMSFLGELKTLQILCFKYSSFLEENRYQLSEFKLLEVTGGSLENLKQLEVEGCNNLTYLFTLSQARTFVHLEEIVVDDCERLKCIIEAKFDGNEKEKHILREYEFTIMLPRLRKISFSNLPKLISFCSENYYSTWQALQELELYSCPELNINDEVKASVQYLIEKLRFLRVVLCDNLCDAIPALLKNGLKFLESLGINGVGGVKVVFQQVEEDIMSDGHHQGNKLLFPSLKTLWLRELPEVEVLYKDPMHIFTLQNLTTLHVYNCSRLTYVLSPTLAQNLLQLEELTIQDCSELEQIIDEDDNGGHIVYDHRQPAVCFPKLISVTIYQCPKLKRLFHISVAASLQKFERIFIGASYELEEVFWHEDAADVIMDHREIVMTQLQSLVLMNLRKLQWIWKAPAHDVSLKNLTTLQVYNCSRLRHVLSPTLAQNLLQLEELYIIGCSKLEQIIDEDDNGGHIVYDHRQPVSFPKLISLTIFRCPKLKRLFHISVAASLQKLERMVIEVSGELEEVFWHEDGADVIMDHREIVMTQLQMLKLGYLPKLQWIWKAPAHDVSLKNLTTLHVYYCSRLRHFLPPTLAQNLLQLEELTIQDCSELEQIIDEDDNGGHIVYDHRQPVSFPKLISLTISRCPKLKRLFHISVAPSLQKLERMVIEDSDELKEVFWHEDGADVIMDHKEIVMNQLQRLKLGYLPKLQWIWKAPVHDVSLKNLTTLQVYNCIRLRHVLSPTLAQNLLQLEELTIQRCSKLEQIIDEDDNGGHIVYDHRQPVSFPKLISFTIYRCPKLKRLFHISVAASLQKLERMVIDCSDELEEVFWHEDGADVITDHKEIVMTQLQTLELGYLPKLQWIWKAPAHDVSLKNLKRVEVFGCNNLTYLFTLSQARDLVQLDDLLVRDCERMKCIIEAKCDDNTGEKHNLQEDETTIVLPLLRELSLSNLPNIISFCSENYYSTWQALETLRLSDCPSLNISSNELKASGQYLKEKLRSLEVDGCDSLGDAIPALLKHGLKNLERLIIERVGGVKVVFQQVEEDIMGGDGHHQVSKLLFPSLKTLRLCELPEVEVLYKDPTHIFTLQNLTTLEVYFCSSLTHVLSPTLARNLLQLEKLTIEDCSELEQIIDEDDNGEHIVYDHRQPAVVCFPKLASLTVRKCPKLKRLFQISIAPSLQNLEYVIIEDNDELEEVFWHKDGADVIMIHKKIVMTQLQSLVLRNLPKLTNFSPVSSEFVCPSLRTKIVEECPKYRTDSKALQYSTGQEEASKASPVKRGDASEQFPSETT